MRLHRVSEEITKSKIISASALMLLAVGVSACGIDSYFGQCIGGGDPRTVSLTRSGVTPGEGLFIDGRNYAIVTQEGGLEIYPVSLGTVIKPLGPSSVSIYNARTSYTVTIKPSEALRGKFDSQVDGSCK